MATRSSASVKRLTLIACILGSGIVLLDGTVVNVALPRIQVALGGGLAAQQWIVNGYLLTLSSLILIGGSLGDLYGERRVFAIGRGRLRRGLAGVRARAVDRRAGGRARACRACAGALLVPSSLAVIVNTFSESERGAAIGSWTAWGAIAGVLGPLVARRAAGDRIVAADLPDQHPAVRDMRGVDPGGVPQAAPRERRRAPGRLSRRAAVRGRARRARVRADRAAAAGLVEPGGVRPAGRGRRAAGLLPGVRGACRRPDAAAGAVPPAQLLRRQHRDVLDVCGPLDPVLLPGAVPAADRRLHAAAERPCDAAGDGDHVRALAPLRRAGRSLRAAPVHGGWAAGGGVRAAAVPACRA